MTISFFLIFLPAFAIQTDASQEDQKQLAEIAQAIRKQDSAWEDLTVNYTCEVLQMKQTKLVFDHRINLAWMTTQKGWEKFVRTSPHPSEPGKDWVEAASFNRDYYMASDSQSSGSGGFGHAVGGFLNNGYSVKKFGLFITGLELNRPISVAELLEMKEAKVKILDSSKESVIVVGQDPIADGIRYKVWLDPKIGYRPAKTEQSDRNGLLATFEIKYKKCKGVHGDFWFPESGIWQGYEPATRSMGNQMLYKLNKIAIDSNPAKSEFVLTYPVGAKLLNYDTGEGFITTSPITEKDAPPFLGKLISMREIQSGPETPSGRGPSFWWWIIGNVLLICCITAYLIRRRIVGRRVP